MRIKSFAAAVVLVCSAALAEAPLVLNVSNSGVEINGVTYTTRAKLVEALRKLNPTAVRVIGAKDVQYQSVADAFQALQESGIKANAGFVGAAQADK